MGRVPIYKVKEDYFEKITTPSQAYVLGFIWADGSISSRHSLTITIHSRDINVLYFIKKQMGSTAPLKIVAEKYAQFSITRKRIFESLKNLNLTENKSKNNAKYPKIPERFTRDFLRGLFDGDGSIWETPQGYKTTFCGGNDFLLLIKEILLKANINSTLRMRHKGNLNACMLDISGNIQIGRLFDFLYYDNKHFALKRKKDKMLKAKKIGLKNRNWKQDGTYDKIKKIIIQDNNINAKRISEKLNLAYSSTRTVARKIKLELNLI